MNHHGYATLCRNIARNLFSHWLPEEYALFKDALTQCSFLVSERDRPVCYNWEDRVIASKPNVALIYNLKLSGTSLNGSFILHVLRSKGEWRYIFVSETTDFQKTRKTSVSPNEDLEDEGFDPLSPPYFPDEKPIRFTRDEIEELAELEMPAEKDWKSDPAQLAFIVDLISSIPTYSKEKPLIRQFAFDLLKENPNETYDASNGASLIPAYRRWKAKTL